MSATRGVWQARVTAGVYFLWALALLHLIAFARYRALLHPMFGALLAAACVVVVVFFYLAFGWPGEGRDGWAETLLRALMLLLPMLFLPHALGGGLGGYAYAKRAVGAPAIRAPGDADASGAPATAEPAEPASDVEIAPGAASVTITDLTRRTDAFLGKRVAVEGQVYTKGEFPEGTFVVFRFVIVCCAADAYPAGILIDGPPPAGVADDDWVRVTGTFRIDKEPDGERLVIKPEAVVKRPLPRPQDRYLFRQAATWSLGGG